MKKIIIADILPKNELTYATTIESGRTQPIFGIVSLYELYCVLEGYDGDLAHDWPSLTPLRKDLGRIIERRMLADQSLD